MGRGGARLDSLDAALKPHRFTPSIVPAPDPQQNAALISRIVGSGTIGADQQSVTGLDESILKNELASRESALQVFLKKLPASTKVGDVLGALTPDGRNVPVVPPTARRARLRPPRRETVVAVDAAARQCPTRSARPSPSS